MNAPGGAAGLQIQVGAFSLPEGSTPFIFRHYPKRPPIKSTESPPPRDGAENAPPAYPRGLFDRLRVAFFFLA